MVVCPPHVRVYPGDKRKNKHDGYRHSLHGQDWQDPRAEGRRRQAVHDRGHRLQHDSSARARAIPTGRVRPRTYKTTWLNTVFFKGTAKFVAEKFSQGDTIVVQGELETSTYEKKDRDGHVIDSNALGMRVRANTVEGPFRVVSKNGNGESAAASNGAPTSSNNGQARQAAPLRQAAPTRQAPASTVAAAVDDDPF